MGAVRRTVPKNEHAWDKRAARVPCLPRIVDLRLVIWITLLQNIRIRVNAAGETLRKERPLMSLISLRNDGTGTNTTKHWTYMTKP